MKYLASVEQFTGFYLVDLQRMRPQLNAAFEEEAANDEIASHPV